MVAADEFYTHGHHPVVVDSHAKRSVADSAQFLLPHLQPDAHLLDFGCGPGSITADLARLIGPKGRVIGIDNSAEALAIARRDADAPGLEYHQASVYDIPFVDASFDLAYGHQVLQHLSDPVAALNEVRRVLKPGGLVAVRDADFGTMTHHPHYPELDTWLEVYHLVARGNGGEPDAGRRLSEWVRDAGFVDIVASTSSWHYTTPPARLEWAQLWANRLTLPRFIDRAAELSLEHTIEPIAAAWLRWATEPDGWFSFVHGEVIAVRPAADAT